MRLWPRSTTDLIREAFAFLPDAGYRLVSESGLGMGVTVTQLTPEEREAFVKATRPVYAKWKPQIGAELVTKAEQAIAARKT